MREYELVYIFKSALAEDEVDRKLERFHAVLEDGESEITAVERWGKQQLSYPIRNETNGTYVVVQFAADPSPLAELERRLKLDEDLLRYLIVLNEGELPTKPSTRGEEEEEDEEDEEGEEDEESGGDEAADEEDGDEAADDEEED